VVVAALAVAATGLGLSTALHKAVSPELSAGPGGAASKDDALIARPIVDLAPAPAAPDAGKNDQADSPDDAKTDAIAAQTAAAQAIQAKPSQSGESIDDVLASPTEKPPPAVKGGANEAPPGVPVKSDVPF
jgi:hypothetical protein